MGVGMKYRGPVKGLQQRSYNAIVCNKGKAP